MARAPSFGSLPTLALSQRLVPTAAFAVVKASPLRRLAFVLLARCWQFPQSGLVQHPWLAALPLICLHQCPRVCLPPVQAGHVPLIRALLDRSARRPTRNTHRPAQFKPLSAHVAHSLSPPTSRRPITRYIFAFPHCHASTPHLPMPPSSSFINPI